MKIIKVVRVIDGDNFIGEDDVNYRLRSVRAPETNQSGFNRCRLALEKLILNKKVEIINEQPNLSYKRPVVSVRIIGKQISVNDKMIEFINDNNIPHDKWY